MRDVGESGALLGMMVWTLCDGTDVSMAMDGRNIRGRLSSRRGVCWGLVDWLNSEC